MPGWQRWPINSLFASSSVAYMESAVNFTCWPDGTLAGTLHFHRLAGQASGGSRPSWLRHELRGMQHRILLLADWLGCLLGKLLGWHPGSKNLSPAWLIRWLAPALASLISSNFNLGRPDKINTHMQACLKKQCRSRGRKIQLTKRTGLAPCQNT